MIWFFIAGFISGAVGVVMYARWWRSRHVHVKELTAEEITQEIKGIQDTEKDNSIMTDGKDV